MFKILAFPVPVNESSPHAIQLFDVNDYFIISSNQQFYTTLVQSALNQCQGWNLMTCTLHPMSGSEFDDMHVTPYVRVGI